MMVALLARLGAEGDKLVIGEQAMLSLEEEKLQGVRAVLVIEASSHDEVSLL